MEEEAPSPLAVRFEYPDSSPHVARRALREAAQSLSERGLSSAAKWALELLIYVPRASRDELRSPKIHNSDAHSVYTATPSHGNIGAGRSSYPIQSTPALNWRHDYSDDHSGRFVDSQIPASPLDNGAMSSRNATDEGHIEASTSSTSAHVHFAPSEDISFPKVGDHIDFGHKRRSQYDVDWLQEDEDSYLLAKSLFDHHQWERCAALLEKRKVQGDKALFLKLYAKFLILERRAEENYFQVSKKIKQEKIMRKDLIPILRELLDSNDPFLLFLKGVLFRKLNKRIEAMDCFLRSIEILPYNWSAWQELSGTIDGGQAELQEIAPLLPHSFMTSFFCELFGRSSAGKMTGDESLQRIDALLQIFPNAPYLLVCKGQNLHLMQDLEASEESYEAARAIDPHRLEGMADYSNSLFVQSKEEKLAHLTHSLAEAGREDAEVCCAVGNYHTLRGDNHRAVEVFKRAVRLDPSCSSAWILLGHAYIELKDSVSASEMYRKALELNPRDVRAWTGLGNTYELNSAWAYALHYHKKAAANSPYDYRFWASMANCYEKLRQNSQAVECYKKILTLEDAMDSQLAIMENIARLYEDADLGNVAKACLWHCRIVELIEKGKSQRGDEMDVEMTSQQIKNHVQSYVIAARWEMGDFNSDGNDRGEGQMQAEEDSIMQAEGDSSDSVSPEQGKIIDSGKRRHGNLALANEYLHRAIMTGTESALEADELLKRLAFMRT